MSEIPQHGWERIDGEYIPTTTNTPIAPDSVIQLVSCNCKKSKCLKSCSCLNHGEGCTDFCGCIGCEKTDPKLPREDLIEDELNDLDED